MSSQPFDGGSVVATALQYLGRAYTKSFTCIDFLREVYLAHGWSVPPPTLNVCIDQLFDNPPVGYALYLRLKTSGHTEGWTHVAIIVSAEECIHCSYFFGKRVVLTPTADLLALYDVA